MSIVKTETLHYNICNMAVHIGLQVEKSRETDLPAARIALDTGFLNAQYFSRAFSSAFGTTPDAWRRSGGM